MSDIKFNDIVYSVSGNNTPMAFKVIALSETQALCKPVVENPELQKLVHWQDLDCLISDLSLVITLCGFKHDELITSHVAEFTRVHYAW
jgi:hypothetical protein